MSSVFCIHELHHHVLESWYKLRLKRPFVISFDHHTDILPAFMRSIENGDAPPIPGKDLIADIGCLRHDEHFDYALKYGIISGAVIISHTPAVTVLPENLQVLYNGDFAENEPINSERYRIYFDNALEDDFLKDFLPYFPENNYILDIDCDYFKTCKSLAPRSPEIFRRLVRGAEMITISRESDWVRLLSFENPEYFTPEYIINCLQSF